MALAAAELQSGHLWRCVKPGSIGTPSWALLWHTKLLSPGTVSHREVDLLPHPGDEQFSSSTYKLPLARLHLLSKRPRTDQHFLHSKAMQGISLLRQLDPFQRRRAAKFPPPPPPAPSSETRCKFGPWRLFVLFHFCPCCLLEVGRKGPSPHPSQAAVECRRERAGSVPERTQGVRVLPKCSR